MLASKAEAKLRYEAICIAGNQVYIVAQVLEPVLASTAAYGQAGLHQAYRGERAARLEMNALLTAALREDDLAAALKRLALTLADRVRLVDAALGASSGACDASRCDLDAYFLLAQRGRQRVYREGAWVVQAMAQRFGG